VSQDPYTIVDAGQGAGRMCPHTTHVIFMVIILVLFTAGDAKERDVRFRPPYSILSLFFSTRAEPE